MGQPRLRGCGRLPGAPAMKQHLRDMALGREYRPKDYHIEAGKLDVQFITPVVVTSLQTEAENEAAKGRKKRTGLPKQTLGSPVFVEF